MIQFPLSRFAMDVINSYMCNDAKSSTKINNFIF